MREDATVVGIGHFFGYTRLERGLRFVAMAGDDGTPRLDVGMIVRLAAHEGSGIADFRDGERVVIVGFQLPHTDGCSDRAVFVSDGTRIAEVKPQRIAEIVSAAPRALRR